MKWSLTILMICLLCSSIAGDTDGWPMFQHDPQHSGHSSSPMPESLKNVWTNENGDIGLWLAIAEDNIFVSGYFSLHALDINTGSLLKSYRKPIRGFSFPAVENDRIYLNAIDGIFCLDTDTGEVLWQHIQPLLNVTSYPITVGGHVFIGGGNPFVDVDWRDPEIREELSRASKRGGSVVCVNAETGQIIWEYSANDRAVYSPAYLDGKIYLNDGSKYAYCLDAQTGEQIWEKEIAWSSRSSLSLDEKRIFIGTYHGIICLDQKTGETLWKLKCDNSIDLTPAAAYNKVFGAAERVLYCLDAENGEVIWKRDFENLISTSLVVADGKVALGTADGTLFIVNAKSGKMCESLYLGDSPVEALALSNGKLVVGQFNGRISCFEGSAHTELIPIILICAIVMVLLVVILILHRRKKHTGE